MVDITFQFYTLTFTPMKADLRSHNAVAKQVLRDLQNERKTGTATLIDKYINRESRNKREMFLYSIYEMPKEKGRFRCSMALLRDGFKPKIKPNNTYDLKELKAEGTVTELTHFFVDFSNTIPLVCIQYNHYGPRAKDIEYYLRQIAHKKLNVAKSTKLNFIMERPFEEVIDNLKNVLNFSIKVRPNNFAKIQRNIDIGHYYSSMNQIGNEYKPKYLKIEASFHTPGNKSVERRLNKKANNFVLDNILNFKKSEHDIYLFDNFEVQYEDIEGEDIPFSLFKGKKEFVKSVDYKVITKNVHWYELIKPDFNDFVDNYEN